MLSDSHQNVLVAGFPYVRERYFATFRSWPEPEHIRFVLPRVWKVKGGAVVYHAPNDARITTTTALFHHSHYPIIGGLLKGWMPAFPLILWRMRRSVNLVYSCSEPTLLTTLYQAVCAKLLGKKHVCFTWENISYEKKLRGLSLWIHLAILKMVMMLSDGLICGNPESAALHRAYTKKPITVIPMNGVDTEFFKKRDSEKSFHGHDWQGKTVYTFIGALGKRKGLSVLVRAFSEVIKAIPSAVLVIAGQGEYLQQLDADIAQSGASGNIVRFGWLGDDEVKQLLNVSDVFLYPSIPTSGWAEQFGYSMAEASLMEIPVIATRSGSIASVVQDEKTGLLVEPNNTAALVHAMERLGRDSDLRSRMGSSGRLFIVEHFSHQIIAKEFWDFFRVLA